MREDLLCKVMKPLYTIHVVLESALAFFGRAKLLIPDIDEFVVEAAFGKFFGLMHGAGKSSKKLGERRMGSGDSGEPQRRGLEC